MIVNIKQTSESQQVFMHMCTNSEQAICEYQVMEQSIVRMTVNRVISHAVSNLVLIVDLKKGKRFHLVVGKIISSLNEPHLSFILVLQSSFMFDYL